MAKPKARRKNRVRNLKPRSVKSGEGRNVKGGFTKIGGGSDTGTTNPGTGGKLG